LQKLTVKNLYKIFGAAPDEALVLARNGAGKDEIYRKTNSVVAVNDISFTVNRGEIFVVMGLSGSGKSTLVRCLNRLIEPTSGEIYLDGDEKAGSVTGADGESLRQIRLRRISMVFQHFALLPHRTVAENAAYGLKARGMSAKERRERAIASLAKVGLDAWADAYPGNLSGGMQQRVGLARALAVDPEVLLMDEPFSALDPLIRREVQDQLLKLQDEIKTTIIFITHDLQEALKLGDQIAIMKDGKFVQVGTAETIVSQPSDDYVRAFTSDVDRSRVLTPRRMMQPALPAAEMAGLARVRADAYLYEVFGELGGGRKLAVVDDEGSYLGVLDPLSVFAHLQATEDNVTTGGRA
jgi:glycine betaine/proline transport system ATP-binding protein